MQKLIIKKPFAYTHKGYERVDYAAGQEIETDDEEMAAVALAEKWAVENKANKSAESKSGKAKG